MTKRNSIIKPIDLSELLKPYYNSNKYIAITQDYTKVVGVGSTPQDVLNQARAKGIEPIITKAPCDGMNSIVY